MQQRNEPSADLTDLGDLKARGPHVLHCIAVLMVIAQEPGGQRDERILDPRGEGA